MNLLFALYGDFTSNSAIPLLLHARELVRLGHRCAVAIPSGLESAAAHGDAQVPTLLYRHVLADPAAVFADGRPADVVHAWTPRENVRRFVTSYLVKHPTPWVIYLEDNEGWIARFALGLAGLHEDVLLQHTDEVISTWTPQALSNPLRYESFIGLADAAVVIQDKLAVDVPPWVPCTTVMPGVDLELFSPRPADSALRQRYGVAANERVIVYPGGLNGFTRPGLEALCRAVGVISRHGTPCRLLRSGPVALDFLDDLPPDVAAAVSDLGLLPRDEMPQLLALSDVFVQPGKHDAFEDLRLPAKLPELLAMGRPVVLPETGIAHLLEDGVNAVFHRTGSPEELAEKCLALFADPQRARAIGEAGRRFAAAHFEPKAQAARLEGVYRAARDAFDPRLAATLWSSDASETPVPALLARKLRLLAKSPRADVSPLEAHARCIEFGLERSRGLEIGMAVRDREIGTLKDEVKASGERIATMSEAIAARDQAIADLAKRVDALSHTVADQGGRLTALNAAINERERHIAALESSLSWRITHPLRAAGRIALRLRSRLRFR